MFNVFRKRDMVQLAIAEFDGQPLAINEIVVHGTVGTFLHGGSTDSMKEVMAPALLQWETIRTLKQRGCAWYDFRGIAPADQPQHHLAGVTRFKMGFGGVERVYPVAGNAVLQPAMYWAYRFAKRIRGSRGD
jgi:lipid II:glycine glycyltransferase (peptidoglycan interpeptide bridge formation enzyme)